MIVEVIHPSVLTNPHHLLLRFKQAAVEFPGQWFQRHWLTPLRGNCMHYREC